MTFFLTLSGISLPKLNFFFSYRPLSSVSTRAVLLYYEMSYCMASIYYLVSLLAYLTFENLFLTSSYYRGKVCLQADFKAPVIPPDFFYSAKKQRRLLLVASLVAFQRVVEKDRMLLLIMSSVLFSRLLIVMICQVKFNYDLTVLDIIG